MKKNLGGKRFIYWPALLLLLICAMQNFAQSDDRKIEEIRRIYQQTNQQITQAEKNFSESEIFLSELVVNQGGTMYPAVGNFRETVKFYYTYGNREQNPYPDRLLKITISTRRSAIEESAEYLFNPAGQLIFYFGRDGETQNRLYFAAGKLIRWQKDEKIFSAESGEARELAKNVLSRKDKLTQIFRNSFE